MPAELVRMLNLDFIYPPFLGSLLALLAECRSQGADYKCYSGHRHFDEQAALYEKYLKGGPRAAPAGLSAHNYGLAVDLARVLPSKLLSWNPKDYDILKSVIARTPLVWGASFGDMPHVQWPGFVRAKDLMPLRVRFNSQKGPVLDRLKLVWNSIPTT